LLLEVGVSTHRRFEDWILADGDLSDAEASLLREHLMVCAACRALAGGWAKARSRLARALPLSPRPGFAERWLVLEAARVAPRRTGAWAIVAISIGASLAAAGFMAWGLATAASSPSAILELWIRQLVSLSLWIRVGGGILEAASGTVPSSLVAGLGLALTLAWAGLIGVWFLSLRRIAYQGVSS
jgi:anti-sigma factor RsiW